MERRNYSLTAFKEGTRIKTSVMEKHIFIVWISNRHLLLSVKAGSLPSVDNNNTRRGWDKTPYCPSWCITLIEIVCSSVLLLCSVNIAIKIFHKTNRKIPGTSQLQKLGSAASAVYRLLLRASNCAVRKMVGLVSSLMSSASSANFTVSCYLWII